MPPWSVPAGLMVPGPRQPSADAPEADRPAADPGLAGPEPTGAPAAEDEAWPGAAPPASWFLRAGQPPSASRPQSAPPVDAPDAAGLSPWQRSQRVWDEAGIQWEQRQPANPRPQYPRQDQPPQAPAPLPRRVRPPEQQWHAPGRHTGPGAFAPQAEAGWPPQTQVPLGAPVFSDPDVDEDDPEDRWDDDRPPIRERPPGLLPGPATAREPWLDDTRLERRRPGRRRTATIVVPAIVLAAVAILALALLTGHGPRFGPLAADQNRNQNPAAPRLPMGAVSFDTYPGQQQRGVFQTVNRIVASGNTMVTIGSQASDGIVRQQFLVSTNAGASWRLAPVRTPGGAQPPAGHPAALLAGGPGGWVAVGPQAIWTSRTGLSWTLAAAHGISPQRPGDSVWVIIKTARGFLAAGAGAGNNAVIWTSRNGVTWQRMTAARLGLAGPGETVLHISYATSRGNATVISGTVARGRARYDAAWLSTSDGAAWTRVTIPADHGAGTVISGLGFDRAGLVAVRPGRAAGGAADGIAYFSPNGQNWQYSATLGAAAGWTPGVVKGSDYGFVVTGTTKSGQIVAYTSTGTGTTWLPAGPLGSAPAESVVGTTAGPAGTVIAVGYTAGDRVSQQPVFVEANTAGSVRPVPLAGVPGAAVPELAVNSTAVAGGQQIAVGSANGYPAVWRKTPGRAWTLVSSLAMVQPLAPALRALTSVTHGPAGWLAVGAPGPIVLTSANGTTWGLAAGNITKDLADVSAVAAASGPAGYVIVGKLVARGGGCVADVWWSPDLTSWTRAHDVNLATGSSQVLAVTATAHGFVSVGSHNGKPAAWVTSDGRAWETILPPAPAEASTAVLQQIAVNGSRVVALGQATTASGTVPFAELSTDGGMTWALVPFGSPGPDTTFTALSAGPAGFTAAGLFGPAGQQNVAVWTSATGMSWKPSQASKLIGSEAWKITALAPAGSRVTGVGSVVTQQSQQTVTFTLPAR